MNEYTPDTDTVRGNYAVHSTPSFPREAREQSFDRWLAEHDRQVKAVAWEEAMNLARECADDTTDSFGNLYRLDWLDRMEHEMERNPYHESESTR